MSEAPFGYDPFRIVQQTCGLIKASDIPPEDANLVEAIMMLALGVEDESGRKCMVRIPAAVAYAAIKVVRSGSDCPQAYAEKIIYKETV